MEVPWLGQLGRLGRLGFESSSHDMGLSAGGGGHRAEQSPHKAGATLALPARRAGMAGQGRSVWLV